MAGVIDDAMAAHPLPSTAIVVATLVGAALLVVVRPVWLLLNNVVTIAHEGGHALVGILTGHSLKGVRLHADNSGMTTLGGGRGLGSVLMTFAGYPAPSLVGLAGAYALAHGRVLLTLAVAQFALLAILFKVRNVFGFVSVVATGLALYAVTTRGSDGAQMAVAYVLTWFLLLAAPKDLGVLGNIRAGGPDASSDVAQLAKLTYVPAVIWLGLMLAVTFGALALAISWLLLR